MRELFFFDAFCQIGSGPGIGLCPDGRGLLADMDRFGVDRALVQHGNYALLGAEAGNRELAAMLDAAGSDRLVGVWCILPDQCPELPQGDEFFALMKRHNIRALTCLPDDHLFIACRLAIGGIMDAALERKIPVMFQVTGRNNWTAVYDFVREFPRNRIIICERVGQWGHDRQIRPLLDHFENVFYATGGYWVPEGIRDLARAYGAERLLFSSAYPRYDQGSGMLQLKQSELAADEIALIAGKNLEKLLDEVQL